MTKLAHVIHPVVGFEIWNCDMRVAKFSLSFKLWQGLTSCSTQANSTRNIKRWFLHLPLSKTYLHLLQKLASPFLPFFLSLDGLQRGHDSSRAHQQQYRGKDPSSSISFSSPHSGFGHSNSPSPSAIVLFQSLWHKIMIHCMIKLDAVWSMGVIS